VSDRRLLLVINPAAQGVTDTVRAAVVEILGEAFRLDPMETKSPGHATEIAGRAAGEGHDMVAVLGGDGVVNEVANGLAGSGVVMAPLPGGGANVFTRALGLPRDAAAAARRLVLSNGSPRSIPLGRADGRYFTCGCGMGFDADIVRHVERRPEVKRRAGEWLFVWEGLRLYFSRSGWSAPNIRASWDGGERSGLRLAVVQNLDPFTYLGRLALRLCPEARLEGGLDLFGLDTFRPSVVVPVLVSAFGRAHHTGHPHVTYVRDRQMFRIEADGPLPCQMDGEYLGERTELEVELVPDALLVLA